MVAIMTNKEIHSANIVIQVSLKESHSATCLIQIYNNTYYGHSCNCYGHPWVLAY